METLYFIPRNLIESMDYLEVIIETIFRVNIIEIQGDNFAAFGVNSRGLKMYSKLKAQFSKEVFRNRNYIRIIKNVEA